MHCHLSYLLYTRMVVHHNIVAAPGDDIYKTRLAALTLDLSFFALHSNSVHICDERHLSQAWKMLSSPNLWFSDAICTNMNWLLQNLVHINSVAKDTPRTTSAPSVQGRNHYMMWFNYYLLSLVAMYTTITRHSQTAAPNSLHPSSSIFWYSM